jgi:signal transduction histidine kinase
MIEQPDVAGHLYRIAQEATNNAVKHARASRITIRLVRKPGRLILEIADDGTGMGKHEGDQKGLGLGVMQHRADVIGAELSIRAKRGEGVTVVCALPLEP